MGGHCPIHFQQYKNAGISYKILIHLQRNDTLGWILCSSMLYFRRGLKQMSNFALSVWVAT